MFSSNITVKKRAGTDVTYVAIRYDNSGSLRVDNGSSDLSNANYLRIAHSASGKKPNIVDRHLVQLTDKSADTSGDAQLTVNLTIARPQSPLITDTMVKDLVNELVQFLTQSATVFIDDTTVLALCRGES